MLNAGTTLLLIVFWYFAISLVLTLPVRALLPPARGFWITLGSAWAYGVGITLCRLWSASEMHPVVIQDKQPAAYTLWDYLRVRLWAHGVDVIYVSDLLIMLGLVVLSTWLLKKKSKLGDGLRPGTSYTKPSSSEDF